MRIGLEEVRTACALYQDGALRIPRSWKPFLNVCWLEI